MKCCMRRVRPRASNSESKISHCTGCGASNCERESCCKRACSVRRLRRVPRPYSTPDTKARASVIHGVGGGGGACAGTFRYLSM